MTKGKGHHPQAYGDEEYWDNRYSTDAGSFDWYQRYSGLAPLINKYVPKESRILMIGCGNAAISEDMVNDEYQNIVNVDISAVVIEAMVKKYKDVPQLQYLRMDVREMKTFKDATFDSVIDKGMFDSLMCGASAPFSAAKILEEVRRVLRPGGVYMLITYGDPRVRLSHLKGAEKVDWTIVLHVIPRPGSKRAAESSSRVITDPVFLNEDGSLGPQFSLEDPDLHYVYVCTKEKKEEDDKKKGAAAASKKKSPAK
jgi:SAM-dependent methyltransferase